MDSFVAHKMEAEKSHHSPPASGKPRRGSSAVQNESKDLSTRGPLVPVKGQKKMDVPAQTTRQEENSPVLCLQ